MQQVFEKAKTIRALALDMDGVLTDGRLFINDDGHIHRSFYVHDGQAMVWLQQQGITVAIITKGVNELVHKRAEMLGIKHVYSGCRDKRVAFDDLLSKLNLQEEQVAYMGDDLPDLPLLQRAGLSVTVPNGCDELRSHADYCTQHSGGYGAVREVCELILKSQGLFEKIIESYQKDHVAK